jgi:GDPmannose 4,6-dehydratase
MAKRALITGVNGQDGAYLARLLLAKGYEVVGALRNISLSKTERLVELGVDKDIELRDIELLEFNNILRAIERARPDEIYNLAAQSYIGLSHEQPVYTGEVDGLGVTRLLEAIRTIDPKIRFFQASSSEMFGKARETPQTETTPFYPRSPYGVAKLYGHWITVNYRESYGLHATSGIMCNHESPLRGKDFVTRKITLALARMKHGELDLLRLGNLDAQRDWGFAGDFVDGMWRMLQQDTPDDYLLATGETHSVREFVSEAGRHFGLDIAWQGNALEERGIDRGSGKTVVTVDRGLFRPAEVDVIRGNSAKAGEKLGWRRSIPFSDLIGIMAEADERRVRDRRVSF